MEKVYVSFTLQNFITIGLFVAFWYFLLCGGINVLKNWGSAVPAPTVTN